MPTTRATILAALHARLQPLAALALRDSVLPKQIPAAGIIILSDGQPGNPEVTLWPLRYHYHHCAGPFQTDISSGDPGTRFALPYDPALPMRQAHGHLLRVPRAG